MVQTRRTSAAGGSKAATLDRQRFAARLAEIIPAVAEDTELSEERIRSMIYRLIESGLLQQERASEARRELGRALGPALADVDPVPYATVEQARRLAELRASLLRRDAYTIAALAQGRGTNANNARQWISRKRRANQLFTASHEGETLVPAFLLDEQLDPRPEVAASIEALRAVGDDGWSLWAWFATPSAWLDGRVPADVLDRDPEQVTEAARRRAAAAA